MAIKSVNDGGHHIGDIDRRHYDAKLDQIAKNMAEIDKSMAVIAEKMTNVRDYIRDVDEKFSQQIKILDDKMSKENDRIFKELDELKRDNLKIKTTVRAWIIALSILSPVAGALITMLFKWIFYVIQHPGSAG